jgi:glycosyltransferase involved in cell wall biosynthesis
VLLAHLYKALPRSLCTVEVLLIDDGSIEHFQQTAFPLPFGQITALRILRLRRNLGHQRAISIGLLHIKEHHAYDAVLVMDADGEDTPEGAVNLIQLFMELHAQKAVFAERSRRSESYLFRCFYVLYKQLHFILTGIKVRVGNFSILPVSYLTTLAVMPELWNHYAATVFRSRLPFAMTPVARGRRIAGTSKMTFVPLVTHGLSAIMVFGDTVGVRLMIACLLGVLVVALGVVAIVAIRFFTDRAIPGWATYTTIALTIVAIQLLAIAVNFTFFILYSRTNLGFVPVRDYSLFVAESIQVWPYE